MNKLQSTLNNIVAFSIGASLFSLLITKSGTYKIAIPVLVIILVAKLIIYYKYR
jgi:hypothetical protein